eukprot:PhF_6_TR37333/c0_g2_i1/m.54979
MLDTLCRHFSSSQENVCCVSITHNSHSPLGSDETSDEHSLVSALFLRILFSMVPSGRGSWLDFKLAFFKSGGTLNSSVFWRAIETVTSPTCTKTFPVVRGSKKYTMLFHVFAILRFKLFFRWNHI